VLIGAVRRIRLVVPYARLHKRRRDQFRIVTQRHKLAAPMMRRSQAPIVTKHGREPAEKLQDRPAPELASNDDLTFCIYAVNLKNTSQDRARSA
jgi:hypothetical protein